MSITLNNAATTGELVIKGPAAGVANLNIPRTDNLAVPQMLIYDTGAGEFVFEDLPTGAVIPTNVSEFTNDAGYQTAGDVATSIAGKADTSALAPVAFSGVYADLTGKPTIPTVPANVSAFTNDSGYQTAADVTSAISGKANTADLAVVATSGDYADLLNKPTAASLGAVETSTVGQPGGVAALDGTGKVPSAQLPSYVDAVVEVADFASLPPVGVASTIYVTIDDGKTYRWGGSAYAEISASPGSTDAVPEGSTNLYFTTARAEAAAPVQSVAGKTGIVVLTATDISGLAAVATSGAYADLTGKPVNVSAFTNDAGYQTAANVATAIAGKADTSSLAPVALSGAYADLTGKPANLSDFNNDTNFVNQTALTAGLALKANTGDLAPVALSGSYADLTGKPTIPTVPTNVSEFTNDAGYLSAVPIATALVVGGVKQGAGVSIAGDGTISVTGVLVDPVVATNTVTNVLATVDTTDATDTLALSLATTDNSSVMFTADVVVQNGNGTSAGGYTLQGVARRSTGAGSLTMVGGALRSIIAEDVPSWDANATVNTITGAIEIRVQGAVANNLSWFVAVRVSKIG